LLSLALSSSLFLTNVVQNTGVTGSLSVKLVDSSALKTKRENATNCYTLSVICNLLNFDL
jgi:hypothetical protein